MTRGPSRYLVPGDVVLALAVSVAQAFDALRLAALAVNAGETDALHHIFCHMHRQLDLIHESLLAVVTEQPEETDGSPRLS